MDHEEESLVKATHDPLIHILNRVVIWAVKALAVMMVFIILWSLVDVVLYIGYQVTSITSDRFNIENLITTLGAFLAVLIAIEVFLNIIFYLKKDVIHVPMVLATALTAVARKVIILDYTTATPSHIIATAAVIFAVGISYWLVSKTGPEK
jgi:uncharacterized membrane protein (DUF373 family)